MSTWHERLQHALDARKNTWADLVKATGLSKPSVYAWKPTATKQTKILDARNAAVVCRFLRINNDWLMHGIGPSGLSLSSDTQAASKSAESNVSSAPDVRGRVPLISWVQAGVWSETVDIYEPGYAERWLPFIKNNGESVFALRVEGDSMTARFGKSYPDGCIIFVDPEQKMPSNGDRIVAKLEGSQMATFKVFTEDAGRRWLRPLNDSHPPIYEAFAVIGKVVGKWEDE